LSNVRFVPQQPRARIPAYIAASDVCLVLLRKSAVFETVIPTKMLEFMSCGRPVILGVGGQARDILLSAQAGLAITPGNSDELCAAILTMKENPAMRASLGRNGREYIVQNLSRQRTASAYLDVLGMLTTGEEQSDNAAAA
jgi:glycosyltransferase involved in cell wall biosynthesis